jgi:hypothetical protein
MHVPVSLGILATIFCCCGYMLACGCVTCCFRVLVFPSRALPLCGECAVWNSNNHNRLFLLHSLPELLEDVPAAERHECGTCMMVLRHILALLCYMFS